MRSMGKKGFTLVEIIVVMVVVGILAAITVPSLGKYIDNGKKRDCEINRKALLARLESDRALAPGVTMAEVLAENTDISCPSGGVYSAPDDNTVECSVHGKDSALSAVEEGVGGELVEISEVESELPGDETEKPESSTETVEMTSSVAPEVPSNMINDGSFIIDGIEFYYQVNLEDEKDNVQVNKYNIYKLSNGKFAYAQTNGSLNNTQGENAWLMQEIPTNKQNGKREKIYNFEEIIETDGGGTVHTTEKISVGMVFLYNGEYFMRVDSGVDKGVWIGYPGESNNMHNWVKLYPVK